MVFFFFFSSRRRHTRSYGDWSSDVCSSDLVGGDAVNGVPARIHTAAAQSKRLIRPERFKLAAGEVQPVNAPDADVIHPNPAVHRKACRHDHSLLRHVTIDVGREGEGLELLGAGIKLHDSALQHHALPDVSVLVYFNIQAALRETALEFGNGVLGNLARA